MQTRWYDGFGSQDDLGKYFTVTSSLMCTQETVSAEELSQLISELNVTMANYQVRM